MQHDIPSLLWSWAGRREESRGKGGEQKSAGGSHCLTWKTRLLAGTTGSVNSVSCAVPFVSFLCVRALGLAQCAEAGFSRPKSIHRKRVTHMAK